MSPLRWTTLPTRNLAAELARRGRKVSARAVGDLLRREGFSLQGNAKTALVGEFENGGREWRPKGSPARAGARDFPDRELGKAIPYGIYMRKRPGSWESPAR